MERDYILLISLYIYLKKKIKIEFNFVVPTFRKVRSIIITIFEKAPLNGGSLLQLSRYETTRGTL